MYNHELVLISQTYERDEWGNQRPIETRTPILCNEKSATRQEFYSAAQAGLRVEQVFEIHSYEYNGAEVVEFEGQRRRVLRTYKVSFEKMELVCGEVIGDG